MKHATQVNPSTIPSLQEKLQSNLHVHQRPAHILRYRMQKSSNPNATKKRHKLLSQSQRLAQIVDFIGIDSPVRPNLTGTHDQSSLGDDVFGPLGSKLSFGQLEDELAKRDGVASDWKDLPRDSMSLLNRDSLCQVDNTVVLDETTCSSTFGSSFSSTSTFSSQDASSYRDPKRKRKKKVVPRLHSIIPPNILDVDDEADTTVGAVQVDNTLGSAEKCEKCPTAVTRDISVSRSPKVDTQANTGGARLPLVSALVISDDEATPIALPSYAGKSLSNISRRDVGIQVDLCHCLMEITSSNGISLDVRKRDASEQACLCCCPDHINGGLAIRPADDELVGAMSRIAIDDSRRAADSSNCSGAVESGFASSASHSAGSEDLECSVSNFLRVQDEASRLAHAANTSDVGMLFDDDTDVSKPSFMTEDSFIVKQRLDESSSVSSLVKTDPHLSEACSSKSMHAVSLVQADDSVTGSFVEVEVCDNSIQTSLDVGSDVQNPDESESPDLSESVVSVVDVSLQASLVTVENSPTSAAKMSQNSDNGELKSSLIASFIGSAGRPVRSVGSAPDSPDCASAPVFRLFDRRQRSSEVGMTPDSDNGDSPLQPRKMDLEVRKVVSSTMIESPLSSASFFGIGLSAIDPDDLSPVRRESSGTRRKSKMLKKKKRVSMCGEYEEESPDNLETFYTPRAEDHVPHRDLTVVMDTDDEEDESLRSVEKSLYRTVVEEYVEDTPSFGKEDTVARSPSLPAHEDVEDDIRDEASPAVSVNDERPSSPAVSRSRHSSSSSEDDADFEQFLKKTKDEKTTSIKPKPNWKAPLDNFIISDDDSLLSEEEEEEDSSSASSDSDFRPDDVFTGNVADGGDSSDKENAPPPKSSRSTRRRAVETSPRAPGKARSPTKTKRDGKGPRRLVSPDDATKIERKSDDLADVRFAVPYPILPTRAASSDDYESTADGRFTKTPSNVLRQWNKSSFPQTVGHCNLGRLSFLKSLSPDVSDYQRDMEAARFVKGFGKLRTELTARLFSIYNSKVFDNELPENMPITWNSRLTKTAGFCRYKSDPVDKKKKVVSIELSTKVCDSPERLRDTLIHELCHAIVWIKHQLLDGHGSFWKHWARKANHLLPDLPPIMRCHTYEISAKFVYQCTKCGYEVRRHSKSLDIEAKVCGFCRAPFRLLVSTPRSGSATPNQFALYVRENYAATKSSNRGMKHGDIMQIISAQYKSEKGKGGPTMPRSHLEF